MTDRLLHLFTCLTRGLNPLLLLWIALSLSCKEPTDNDNTDNKKNPRLARLVWEYDAGRGIVQPLAWSSDRILFIDQSGTICILDNNGRLLFRYLPDKVSIQAPLLVDEGFVILDTSGNLIRYSDDGTKLWEYSSGLGSITNPCHHKDYGYFMHCGDSLFIRVTDDGKEVYRSELKKILVSGPCTLEGIDQVFLPIEEGEIIAINAETGDTIWHKACGRLSSGLAVSTDMLIANEHDGSVRAYSNQTGDMLWSRSLAGPFWVTPIIKGSNVYTASLYGIVYCLNLSNGNVLWQRSGFGGLTSPLSAGDNALCISDSRGSISLLSLDDGNLICSLPIGSRVATGCLIRDSRILVSTVGGSIMLLSFPEINGRFMQYGGCPEHSFFLP